MSKSSANIFVRAGRASRTRRGLAIAATAGLAVGLSLLASPASAYMANSGVFQLDGNAVSSLGATATAHDDWDKVCYEVAYKAAVAQGAGATAAAATATATCTNAGVTSSASAVGFANDGAQNASIFTGGGSKDPLDVSSWQWKDQSGGLPDKDNLQNSFAARYPTTSTSTDILNFGSDRYDNSGDAQQGFWFFQKKVILDKPTGRFFDAATGLPATHTVGDLLILSDFSVGGSTSTISVYMWVGSGGDTNGTLDKLNGSTSASCDPLVGTTADAFCGIVNKTESPLTVAPWSFTDKSGNHGYLNGEFYEGGVDLKAVGTANNINLSGECFASFASETRSSTSPTATLKDFVLGNFGDCTATLSTSVSAASVNPAAQVRDTATVVGSRPTITPTGDVTFFLCSFTAGTTDVCDDSNTAHHGAQLSPQGTLAPRGAAGTSATESPYVNTAAAPLLPGRYCFRAEWPGDTNYTTALKEFSGATECFNVTDSSSLTTAQNWHPEDSTTITSTGGTALSGTVVFTLYDNGTCDGTVLYTSSAIPVSGAANTPVTVSTVTSTIPNTVTVSAIATTTVSWKAVYTSNTSTLTSGTTGACESTTLTINNDINK